MRSITIVLYRKAVVLFLLASTAAVPSAAQTEPERDSLKGLTGVYVLIEDLPNDATQAGLTTDTFRTDVELRLRRSGIKVLGREELFRTPGEPRLYSNVNVLCDRSGICAYSVSVSFQQD